MASHPALDRNDSLGEWQQAQHRGSLIDKCKDLGSMFNGHLSHADLPRISARGGARPRATRAMARGMS